MTALYEVERPRSFSEVAGHKKTLKRLACTLKTTGLDGQVYWITGESGTGKTTLAKIIASHVAPDCCTYEIDAQKLLTDTLDEWYAKSQAPSLFGQFAFIVNEAHTLTSKIVSALQTVLEDPKVQRNSTWIFTTTNRGEQLLFDTKFDACPFLSRAIALKLELDEETVHAMAERLQAIARKHECDGKPIGDYVQLLIDSKFNMRKALQEIASGAMLD
jgi:replication-associated recombination protein RarA